VCFTLDQLSNLNFTPKPFMDEVKIVKNVSTIKLEEKIPIYMSDKNQKSAKEILGKTKVHFEVN
jgi:U3 small nucleolar ribonucleoprotein component